MEEKLKSGRFGRFWKALGELPSGGNDSEGLKELLCDQYSGGRTRRLHELTEQEYVRLCEALERDVRRASSPERTWGLRKLRSRVLVEMRLWGVTGVTERSVDWSGVDAFCLDKRISGKRFCALSYDELVSLLRKLKKMNLRRFAEEG